MKTYAFIDASNLFYGGVETHTFRYDYMQNHSVPLDKLINYLNTLIKEKGKELNEAQLLLISRHIQRVKFYLKLQKFGYQLFLKPVKLYEQEDGTTKRKANCDVEMAFYLMKEKEKFNRVIVLSGDGDFLAVLKHLKDQNKDVIILSRGPRTAKEIRQFAGANFRDFVRLENHIKFVEK